MSAWTDVWDLIKATVAVDSGDYQAATSDALGSGVPQAAASGAGAWGAITGFLTAITDWHLWSSLGWLLLGLVLIVTGVALWLRLPQEVSRLGPAGLL